MLSAARFACVQAFALVTEWLRPYEPPAMTADVLDEDGEDEAGPNEDDPSHGLARGGIGRMDARERYYLSNSGVKGVAGWAVAIAWRLWMKAIP